MSEFLKEVDNNIKKTFDALASQFKRVRGAQATPAMLDGIKVPYYGTDTPLTQVATLSMPDPRVIIVQPFEKSLLKEIEKAIHTSSLGISPQNDGQVIRLPIPPLNEDRRKDIAKQIKKIGEDAKVAIRQHRKNILDDIKKKEKEMSKDDVKKEQDNIQKSIDDAIKKVDVLTTAKEKEILTV